MQDFENYLKLAKEAAKTAGKYIINEQNRNIELMMLDNGKEYFTQVDINSQNIICDMISSTYPDHLILSEEKNSISFNKKKSEYIWHVDPIDGTWNYINGGEWYSVSIALQKRDTIIVGCIYQPTGDRLFTTIKGTNKAFCNNKMITPSSSKFLGEWLISFGYPSRFESMITENFEHNLFQEYDTGDPKRPIKIWRYKPGRGAMALEFCNLASGMINAIVRFKQKPWDVAAGLLIAEESGAKITNIQGKPWQEDVINFNTEFYGDYIGVSNPEMFSTLMKLLNEGVIE